MRSTLLIGLAAGLACTVLLASAMAGNPFGRFLLSFLTPLPMFLAGLGWGWISALVAATTTAVALALFHDVWSGLGVAVNTGLPVVLLSYLAQLNRPLPPAPSVLSTGAASPSVEWYPIGRMVAMVSAIAGGAGLLTAILILGADIDTMRASVSRMFEGMLKVQIPGMGDRKLSPDETKLLTETILHTLPGAFAFAWLGGLLLNFYLAGRITLASGRLPRPWPDLAATTFPRGFGFGMTIAMAALLFLSGMPKLAGSSFAGAFMLSYLLAGLAVIHFVTRGKPMRPMILSTLYLLLLLFSAYVVPILAVILIGVLEPILPWRRWRQPPPQSGI